MKLSRMLATFFGSGHAPLAPGTAGSAAALALWVPAWLWLPAWAYAALAAASAPMWFWAAARHLGGLRREGRTAHDPQEIVCDEALGMGLALCFLPHAWSAPLLAFAFFRLFDASKLPPVNWCERLPGAWGVMADDAAAGLMACGASHLVLRLAARFL